MSSVFLFQNSINTLETKNIKELQLQVDRKVKVLFLQKTRLTKYN